MPARTVHQILEYTKVDGTCHHERATQPENKTGVYYDEGGHPMQASALVRDPGVRVVAETRALLAENAK